MTNVLNSPVVGKWRVTMYFAGNAEGSYITDKCTMDEAIKELTTNASFTLQHRSMASCELTDDLSFSRKAVISLTSE